MARSRRDHRHPRAGLVLVIALGVLAAAACTTTTPDASVPGGRATTLPPLGRSPGSGVIDSTGTTGPSGTDGTTRGDPPGTVDPGRSSTAGIGHDHAFPQLGSAAYDVEHYDLQLDYQPDTNDLRATARIDAIANEDLTQVRLDFDGLSVDRVQVDDATASSTVVGKKLEIDAPATVPRASRFVVTVDYHGRPRPTPTRALDGVEVGWHGGDGSSFVLSEPEGASTWFPVNNHPLDKATYTIAVTVPQPYVAVANGRLASTDNHDGARTFHWVMDQPMANYLASVVTGSYREVPGGDHDGVAFSSWLPADPQGVSDGDPGGGDGTIRAQAGVAAVRALASRLGPFPFATYGAVAYPASAIQGEDPATTQFLSQVALEVQGRSLYAEAVVGDESTVTHETAHQWMGDSVSLTDWSRDIWWVEGFASFSESIVQGGRVLDEPADARRYDRALETCAGREAGDIPLEELFSDRSYTCGALVFYALLRTVGPDPFWSILRAFNERHRYANATTDDLIAVASEVSGQDLAGFFHEWLFGPLPSALP